MKLEHISLKKNDIYKIHFAFITSSYNQSQFIEKNLDSIRNQNYNNYIVYSRYNIKKICKKIS